MFPPRSASYRNKARLESGSDNALRLGTALGFDISRAIRGLGLIVTGRATMEVGLSSKSWDVVPAVLGHNLTTDFTRTPLYPRVERLPIRRQLSMTNYITLVPKNLPSLIL